VYHWSLWGPGGTKCRRNAGLLSGAVVNFARAVPTIAHRGCPDHERSKLKSIRAGRRKHVIIYQFPRTIHSTKFSTIGRAKSTKAVIVDLAVCSLSVCLRARASPESGRRVGLHAKWACYTAVSHVYINLKRTATPPDIDNRLSQRVVSAMILGLY
jgi:hypothetical protein